MPNYCFNQVNMRKIGDHKEFYDEKGQFDFNKIIECPKELYDTKGALPFDMDLREVIVTAMENLLEKDMYSYISSGYLMEKLPIVQEERRKLNKLYEMYDNYPRETCLQEGLKRFEMLVKYGFQSWYEFCTNVWGTKWNAWDTFVVDLDNIEFITAWSPPVGIFQKISEMYPYDLMTVNWSEEGGINGILQYHGGECIYDREYVYDQGYEDYEAIEENMSNRLFTKVELLPTIEDMKKAQEDK